MTTTDSIIILDSSALISLFSADDSNNSIAIKISKKIKKIAQIIVVPDAVFVETLNTLGRMRTIEPSIRRERQLELGNLLLNSKEYVIAETSMKIRRLALQKLKDQPNSTSFTDCIVMAIADVYQTKLIFGFDKIFQQNKYRLP